VRLTTPIALGAALAVLLTATACSKTHDVAFEVSGDAQSAIQVRYHTPADGNKDENWHAASKPPLPWKTAVSSEYGFMRLEATPASGALTCRILDDGKEVLKVTGKPGEPVSCVKIVNDE
jgi:hypothetical protein